MMGRSRLRHNHASPAWVCCS